jgi:hypothetical protein
MSVVEAAVIAAWIVIVVMALALAGVVRQLRELHERLAVGSLAQHAGRTVPEVLRPRPPARASLVLSVEEGCQVCAEVAPAFAEAARRGDGAQVDFVVLSATASPRWPASERVRTVIDAGVRRAVGVPWTPALLTIGPDGGIDNVDPAGSEATLRRLVGERAGAAARDAEFDARNGEGGSR